MRACRLGLKAWVCCANKEGKGEGKSKKALGWKIGAGGAEKAPREARNSRAVRESLWVLPTGKLERRLKKEKRERKKKKKKPTTFPCCQELLDESAPVRKGFSSLRSGITPRLSPIPPGGVGLHPPALQPTSSPAPWGQSQDPVATGLAAAGLSWFLQHPGPVPDNPRLLC